MAFSRYKPHVRSSLESLITPLKLLGVSPNAVTLLSLFFSIIATMIFFFANHVAGLALFIVSIIFDALDGALARRTNTVTKFGAYLDSVTDKIVESLIFFCFGAYSWPLSFLAGTSSILVSYSKHRADEFKVKVGGGLFERPERIGFIILSGVVLELISLQNLIPYILIISIILSTITVIQRMLKAKSLLS